MGVAHLIAPQATAAVLVDEGTPREAMVDHRAAQAGGTTQRGGPERHGGRDYCRVQNDRVPRPLLYCAGIADDDELRLLGDVAGKRVVELGVSEELLSIALAERGAKAIAVEPDPQRIAGARDAAERAGVRVEFHHADIADLGFATSGSVDLAVCSGTLSATDDVPRLLRQVHRVLRAESPLVLAVHHPAARLVAPDARGRYGTPPSRSVAELYMALHRANFRVDVVAEPLLDERDRAPALLVLRARKIGR